MLETWHLLILKIFLLNLFGNENRFLQCVISSSFSSDFDNIPNLSLFHFPVTTTCISLNRFSLTLVTDFNYSCLVVELETEDKLEYTWFPAGPSGVVFRVRAAHDAHLALTSTEGLSNPMLEVFIGGWSNQKSVIRKNQSKPDVVEEATPDALSGSEFRGFWIRWTDNVITVGREGEAAAFMSYDNPESFPINFVGICTGWGATGSWIIEAPQASAPIVAGGGSAVWVATSGTAIPAGAFIGGEDNGEGLIVGRAQHEGALLPGKVVASHGVCYVAWGGGEHGKPEYEVLVGSGAWVPGTGSEIPPNALPCKFIFI